MLASVEGAYINVVLPPFFKQTSVSNDNGLTASLKIMERLVCKVRNESPEGLSNIMKGVFTNENTQKTISEILLTSAQSAQSAQNINCAVETIGKMWRIQTLWRGLKKRWWR